MSDGIYIIRTRCGDVNGYYVGKSERNIWKRIHTHAKTGGQWKDSASIGHNIVGIEAVFERIGEHKGGAVSKLSRIERVVTTAFAHRYSMERVYGGGYSKKRSVPSIDYRKNEATPEFVSSIEGTQFEWILDAVQRIRPEVKSPHYEEWESNTGTVGSENRERTWRIYDSPPLE